MYGGSHIKYSLRQLDPETGALVDDLIEQLQKEVIRIAGLQHLQFAYIQIPPGGVGLLVETLDDRSDRIALGLHAGLILEDQEEPVPDGVAGNSLADLPDVVPDHLPAGLVLLPFRVLLHPLHILRRIRRERPGLEHEIIRCNLQIGGKSGNDVLPVIGRFQVDVDRQHLQDLDEAVIPGNDHAADDVLDGEPRLDTVPVAPPLPAALTPPPKISSLMFIESVLSFPDIDSPPMCRNGKPPCG